MNRCHDEHGSSVETDQVDTARLVSEVLTCVGILTAEGGVHEVLEAIREESAALACVFQNRSYDSEPFNFFWQQREVDLGMIRPYQFEAHPVEQEGEVNAWQSVDPKARDNVDLIAILPW